MLPRVEFYLGAWVLRRGNFWAFRPWGGDAVVEENCVENLKNLTQKFVEEYRKKKELRVTILC